MAETSEPPIKKKKLTSIDEFINNVVDSNVNLVPVMDDVYVNPIPLIKCYAGHVKNIKQLSEVIHVLNEKLPLKDLQHLKRIHKHSVLICPVGHFDVLDNYQCIRDYIQDHVPEIKDAFEFIREVEVPAIPPMTKKQHVETNRRWNCNFHPNKHLEKMLSNACFMQRELRLHRLYMGMAFEILKNYLLGASAMQSLRSANAAIVVDPTTMHVVTIGVDKRQDNPLQHATMAAIDNVAKTQDGGAWETTADMDELIWKLKNKFVEVKFGARKYVSKKDSTASENANDSPYLCTGYDIYLIREPCVMCAMGLVHARIKRVFYTFPNPQGALRSRTKLHCLQSLNHRYEVFTGFEH